MSQMKHLINVLARCLKDVSLKRLKSCVNRDNKKTFNKHFKRDISETVKIDVSRGTFIKCLSKLFKRHFTETFKILHKLG